MDEETRYETGLLAMWSPAVLLEVHRTERPVPRGAPRTVHEPLYAQEVATQILALLALAQRERPIRVVRRPGVPQLEALQPEALQPAVLLHEAHAAADLLHGAHAAADLLHGVRAAADLPHEAREAADLLHRAHAAAGLLHGAHAAAGLLHGVRAAAGLLHGAREAAARPLAVREAVDPQLAVREAVDPQLAVREAVDPQLAAVADPLLEEEVQAPADLLEALAVVRAEPPAEAASEEAERRNKNLTALLHHA